MHLKRRQTRLVRRRSEPPTPQQTTAAGSSLVRRPSTTSVSRRACRMAVAVVHAGPDDARPFERLLSACTAVDAVRSAPWPAHPVDTAEPATAAATQRMGRRRALRPRRRSRAGDEGLMQAAAGRRRSRSCGRPVMSSDRVTSATGRADHFCSPLDARPHASRDVRIAAADVHEARQRTRIRHVFGTHTRVVRGLAVTSRL